MKLRVLNGKLTPESCKTGDKSPAIYHGMYLIRSREAIREGISFYVLSQLLMLEILSMAGSNKHVFDSHHQNLSAVQLL